MADLLECLIQIKGLADTPRRLSLRLASAAAARAEGGPGDATPVDVAATLALAEERFALCLETMLSSDRPRLPAIVPEPATNGSGGTLAEWQERFTRGRLGTTRVLAGCSAADLGRTGIEPSRGPMTVADLVALMLAHDTDQLGRLVPAAGR